jgi:hypothetical protein
MLLKRKMASSLNEYLKRRTSVVTVRHPSLSALHCKKRLSIFPSPAGMSLTKLSLTAKLFPATVSSVSGIPAGDGKMGNLFYSVASLLY